MPSAIKCLIRFSLQPIPAELLDKRWNLFSFGLGFSLGNLCLLFQHLDVELFVAMAVLGLAVKLDSIILIDPALAVIFVSLRHMWNQLQIF